MNDTCICDNAPKVWRLTGVTRTLRLRIFNPDGTPLDLTGRTVGVTIARDNSEFVYAPGFVIEGDDNNVVKFEWPADQQGAGDYTINVTTTDGSGNADRVNWHGPTGIRLVDFSFMVRGEDALGVTSEANIGLDGTFTMNGTGMSAYDEWLAEGHTGTPEDFIAWLRQPATDAASAAEAQMGQIQERADADHTRAGNDHTTAGQDHTRAGNDHTTATDNHRIAAADHSTATDDHTLAASDHATAEADHTQAASDHTTAEADHGIAASDHTAAAADHTQAGSDHSRAESDHTTAASDHSEAGTDHTRAEGDHATAGQDHTQAGSDHTTAAADHTTAAADHTQATADHAVMAGYDTRLGNVEDEVSQLGQKLIELAAFAPTGSSVFETVEVGQVVYNTTTKLLRKKLGESAWETVPYYDGAIYSYDGYFYTWDGENLISKEVQRFDSLEKELDIKTSAFELYDYRSLPSAGRVITSNNTWASSSSKSTLVPVNPGDVFRFEWKSNSGFIALLKSDTNYDSGKTVDFCTEYPGRFSVVSEEQPVANLVMPSDCHYIYVVLDNSHGNINTEISKGGSIDSKIESVDITVDKCNLLKGGAKLVDGIGFNSALQGIGDSLSAVYLQLVRGKSYRLNIVNPLWARTSATTTILMLRARKNDAWQTPIVLVGPTSNVANYYDFVFPECEYLQLAVRADAGEFVYFTITERPDSGPDYTATVLRNVHIAMMNKYAERYGAELSTFMAPNGNSKVCAKDIALLCLAAVENNMISSFWGKKKVNAPVFGANSRLDVYESTYTDEDSHPMVADLSAYYHIFGGKTGSGGTPSQGRNLVLAVKSKVDDSWLVGCVLYSTNDVLGDNRFSVMKQLFDLLEEHRTGATVDPSSLSCQGAYAFVVPKDGNLQNYGDYPFISVGKNETGIIDSHSIVKLLTAIVATDWLLPYEMLTFTSEDPYGGTSGNMYSAGDQLYAIDALISMLLTSSSIAARCIARYVGQKVILSNEGAEIYSFRLLNRTAYGVGSQTWLQWIASSDYQVWSAETGITLECEDSESEISISTGGTLSGVTGGSIISANTIYS